ncbi:MAG: ATPase, T2SS/T4P/T4SS family, partial [Thiohalomonadales bacterium]
MATPTSQMKLSGLPRTLVLDGHLKEADAVKAVEQAQKKRVSIVTYLVEQKLVNARLIATVASVEFGIPLFDIDAVEFDPDVTRLVDEKLIRKHNGLPLFKRGTRLYIAVSDPTNLVALDEIKFHAGLGTDAILVEENKLKLAIEKATSASDTSMDDLDADLDDLDIGNDEPAQDTGTDGDVDDAPVVRFVNKVLLDAINSGASDVHFEPYEKYYRVRVRRDGILYEIATPPIALALRLSAR